ncbi:MAG: hypothetical protein ABIE03_05555 [Patescibacteria group bacterium]|nr:hypothetical protein [Patescibacteria group bacterium]
MESLSKGQIVTSEQLLVAGEGSQVERYNCLVSLFQEYRVVAESLGIWARLVPVDPRLAVPVSLKVAPYQIDQGILYLSISIKPTDAKDYLNIFLDEDGDIRFCAAGRHDLFSLANHHESLLGQLTVSVDSELILAPDGSLILIAKIAAGFLEDAEYKTHIIQSRYGSVDRTLEETEGDVPFDVVHPGRRGMFWEGKLTANTPQKIPSIDEIFQAAFRGQDLVQGLVTMQFSVSKVGKVI